MTKLFLKLDPLEELFEMARAKNPDIKDFINETNFTVGNPTVITDGRYNTAVLLTAKAGSGVTGNVKLEYDRINIGKVFNTFKEGIINIPTIRVPLSTASQLNVDGVIIDYLNTALGINLVASSDANTPSDVPNLIFASLPAIGESKLYNFVIPSLNRQYRLLPGTDAFKFTLVNSGHDLRVLPTLYTPYMIDATHIRIGESGVALIGDKPLGDIALYAINFSGDLGFSSSFEYVSGNWQIKDLASVNARLVKYGALPIIGAGKIKGAVYPTFTDNTMFTALATAHPNRKFSSNIEFAVPVEHGRTDITTITAGVYYLGYNKL